MSAHARRSRRHCTCINLSTRTYCIDIHALTSPYPPVRGKVHIARALVPSEYAVWGRISVANGRSSRRQGGHPGANERAKHLSLTIHICMHVCICIYIQHRGRRAVFVEPPLSGEAVQARLVCARLYIHSSTLIYICIYKTYIVSSDARCARAWRERREGGRGRGEKRRRGRREVCVCARWRARERNRIVSE